MLMDSSESGGPHRRTALVGRKLGRYRIEIAGLSETHISEAGRLKNLVLATHSPEVDASEEWCETGRGFAIKSDLVGKLLGLPKGINDRLMTLRFPFWQ